MGVALAVCGGRSVKSEVAYLPVGANQIRGHWLPIIEGDGLQLLDAAVTAGLSVSPEYHPQLVRGVEMLLSKLRERLMPVPECEDVLQRVGRLLERLKMHPRSESCEVCVG